MLTVLILKGMEAAVNFWSNQEDRGGLVFSENNGFPVTQCDVFEWALPLMMFYRSLQ